MSSLPGFNRNDTASDIQPNFGDYTDNYMLATAQRHTISVRIKEPHQASQEARARQKDVAFWEKYRTRSGIEGTFSQGVRAFGMHQVYAWGCG